MSAPASLLLAAALLCLAACGSSPQFETLTLLGHRTETSAAAQEPERVQVKDESSDEWAPTWHTAQVRAGMAFIGLFDTDISLNSERFGRGSTLNFEDDLGFAAQSNVARIDAFYRFNRPEPPEGRPGVRTSLVHAVFLLTLMQPMSGPGPRERWRRLFRSPGSPSGSTLLPVGVEMRSHRE